MSLAVKWSPFTATDADLKVLPADVAVSLHWISVRRGPSPWNVIQSWSTITFSLPVYTHYVLYLQFLDHRLQHTEKWCLKVTMKIQSCA